MSIDHDGEETFADVLNGFSLTGHHRAHGHPESRPAPARQAATLVEPDDEQSAASVRAYAWTGGRTQSDVQLELESLVSTTVKAEDMLDTLCTEHQAIARLCHASQSVAEVAARLSVPLGVIRVLLGDMAKLGLVDVHTNPGAPDLALMERVLKGLVSLRKTPAR
jgi:Protein of unknown function (DUF742)